MSRLIINDPEETKYFFQSTSIKIFCAVLEFFPHELQITSIIPIVKYFKEFVLHGTRASLRLLLRGEKRVENCSGIKKKKSDGH